MEILADRSMSIREAVEDVQVTLADRHRAGGDGDLPVPALGGGDHHPGARGADLAHRHLRGDVRVRILHQQHDAAGPDAVRRLRGRRCDRHAGEHRPPHRGRHAAVRGGAQGVGGNRLHHHFDHLRPDRRVHSGADDGRHGRAGVPRIRGHHRGGDHPVGLRVADAHADAVRACAQGPSRGREPEHRPAPLRGDVPQLAARLRGVSRPVPQVQVRRHPGDARDARRHRLALHDHSERILPDRGYRLRQRHGGRAFRHLVQSDVCPPAAGRGASAPGPRRRLHQFDGGDRRAQPDQQQRPAFHRAQAAHEREENSTAIIQRLRVKANSLTGVQTYFQNVQNINITGRVSKSEYQYTMQSSDIPALYTVGPDMLEKIKALPDCATSPATSTSRIRR